MAGGQGGVLTLGRGGEELAVLPGVLQEEEGGEVTPHCGPPALNITWAPLSPR